MKKSVKFFGLGVLAAGLAGADCGVLTADSPGNRNSGNICIAVACILCKSGNPDLYIPGAES